MSQNKIQDIYVQEYTPKSLVVRGNTKVYKDQLKQMGGKYNSRLRDDESSSGVSPGWIFAKNKRDLIDSFLYTGEVDTEEEERVQGVIDEPPKRFKLKPDVAKAVNDAVKSVEHAPPCPHCQDLRKEIIELNQKVEKILTLLDNNEQIRKNMMAGAGNMMKNIFGATVEMMSERVNEIYNEEIENPPIAQMHRIMRPPPSVTILDEEN